MGKRLTDSEFKERVNQKKYGIKLIHINHPQTTSESNKHSFIANLVKQTLDKELKVS